ncbi:MAG: hypothetical protein M3Q98_13295 [Actinomycetota bacterium]|nr:hypothetical protein [Actinomycetota bacterium]
MIELNFGTGVPGDGGLRLRVSEEVAVDLESELSAAGLEYDRGLEFSSGPELIVIGVVGVVQVGGIQQLAAVLDAFLQRHRNRQFKVTSTTTTTDENGSRSTSNVIETNGYSRPGLERILNAQAEIQRREDDSWNRIKGRAPDQIAAPVKDVDDSDAR